MRREVGMMNRRLPRPAAGLALAAAWLLLTIATPAAGQNPAAAPSGGAIPADIVAPGPPFTGWTAEVSAGRERYTADNGIWRPWTSADVLVARGYTGGSIGVAVTEVSRFDRRDGALSFDVYRALWEGAHGHVRGQVAREAVVLPGTDISAELYQGFAGGWEPSVGIRRLGYPDAVLLTSLSLGKYVGDRWYGRLRGTRAERGGGSSGSSGSVLGRRYLGSSREYVEVSAGAGREAITAGLSVNDEVVVDIRRSGFVEVGGRKYLTRRFGGAVAAGYNTFEAIPARIGARVGIIARF